MKAEEHASASSEQSDISSNRNKVKGIYSRPWNFFKKVFGSLSPSHLTIVQLL
jgi:hypothetical protein